MTNSNDHWKAKNVDDRSADNYSVHNVRMRDDRLFFSDNVWTRVEIQKLLWLPDISRERCPKSPPGKTKISLVLGQKLEEYH